MRGQIQEASLPRQESGWVFISNVQGLASHSERLEHSFTFLRDWLIPRALTGE